MTVIECLFIYFLSGLLSFPIAVKLIRFVNSHFGTSGDDNVKK